ncbi:PREDICTED: uncharacterized protein LOC104592584 [Nelumbo nucifera]|uniref:Uncharacterized protein LOC104592584 n=2 Tax=Nelumbo nucifera TaxID=4432 RepID=A0A1U7ZFW9_NELNU|nr:PREDICTED: uncharacterized protein LOC104592584 [Nelumbo nucifera]DAD44570.1 TPA_asm: hypothetical protein HUJ06_002800 [Nelumbo nucifera]
MGEGPKPNFGDPILRTIHSFPANATRHDQWAVMDADEDFHGSPTTSSSEVSTASIASSSLDYAEDASSSSSQSSSDSSPPMLNEPLYELSEVMAQLPIRRGLSKHYQGKSQSFSSLYEVSCIEDLVKRENPHRKKTKSCGLFYTNKSFTPKAFISKKTSRTILSKNSLGKRNSFTGSCRAPPVPVQRNS